MSSCSYPPHFTMEIELGKAAEKIKQLEKVRTAALNFIGEFPTEIIAEHGYQEEWNNLCDATFSTKKL